VSDVGHGRRITVETTTHAHRNVLLVWIVVAGLAGLVALNGCGHAHGVEHPAAAGTQANGEGQGAHASNAPNAPSAPNAKPPADHPERVAPQTEPGKTPDATDVPLSTSRAGLLEPGAARKVQEKLVSLGFLDQSKTSGALDEPTGAALRRFQQSRELVITGAPDQETVGKLGLDPKEIFRSATGTDTGKGDGTPSGN